MQGARTEARSRLAAGEGRGRCTLESPPGRREESPAAEALDHPADLQMPVPWFCAKNLMMLHCNGLQAAGGATVPGKYIN